ncbi:MAG: hypothetical protein ACO1PB_17415 [Ramlibacter sp.]
MIAFNWIVFALLALFWTGGAWVTAAATEWLAQALASGTAVQAARDLAALPLPAWLQFWIDPAWLQALQSMVRWAVEGAGAGLPFAGTAAGWLVPAVWVAWGIGCVLLLLGAVAVHVVLRRFARRRASPEPGIA